MATTLNAKRKYEAALDSASKVIDAILSLDIPVSHMRRYLDRAIWHVTVPTESLKYQTRYVSFEAREVLETLRLFSQLRQTVERAYRLMTEISEPSIQAWGAGLDDETKKAIEVFGFTEPTRQATVIRTLKDKERSLKSQLRHEHVTSRKDLISELLERRRSAADVLKEAISCTVTREEHDEKLANPAVRKLTGTTRYSAAGIRVWDSVLQQVPPWSAS